MNAPKVTPERQALNAAKKHLKAGRKDTALSILVIYSQSLLGFGPARGAK